MPKTYLVVTGPAQGVPRAPVTGECEAVTVQQALLQADKLAGVHALRGDSRLLVPGVTVFINGADIRFSGGLNRTLSGGDVVGVVCPATDT